MKKIFAIAATAVLMLSGLSSQAQTIYTQKNKHYRPQPGAIIGGAGRGGHGPQQYTRFSAIVEGGLACLVDNADEYKSLAGTMSMSAGALVNETIFAGAMLKYSSAGTFDLKDSKTSNCIIGADVRYYFPGYIILPFVGGQVGGDIRKQTALGITGDSETFFYGGVKVGAKYELSPFLSAIFAVGVDNAGGITTIPFTIGFQF